MTIKCSAKACTSNEKTEIDGEKIEFYSFPVDKNLRNEWKRICVASNAKQKLWLCELHFATTAFDSARQLKPDAVPTIQFSKEEANEETITVSDSEPARKKSKTSESNDDELSKAKPFRLTIEISKIILQPSPLSENTSQTKSQPSNETSSQNSQEQPASFENGNDKQNSLQCLVCKELFSDITDLYKHNKIHFTCDICNTEFTSRSNYENHYELHKSNVEQCPYKCKDCKLLFESKGELCKHIHLSMDKCSENTEENRIQYCESCDMTFSDDLLFRDHLDSHLGSWYVDTRDQLHLRKASAS